MELEDNGIVVIGRLLLAFMADLFKLVDESSPKSLKKIEDAAEDGTVGDIAFPTVVSMMFNEEDCGDNRTAPGWAVRNGLL